MKKLVLILILAVSTSVMPWNDCKCQEGQTCVGGRCQSGYITW